MEMYYSSDDSEFDCDAREQEIELYTKLYFEPELNHRNTQCYGKTTNISDSQNVENGCARELTLTKLLNNNLQSHSNIRTLSNKDHENRKRKRNTSLCSIGSISGSEPLDNLYCIHSSDDECNLEVIPEVSITSLDESHVENSKYHNSDGESTCNMFLNKKEYTSTKNMLNVSTVSYTDVREKTISKNEIEILKCVKKGKLSQSKPARKNNVNVLSSGNSGSDTDDSKEFHEAVRLSAPLTLNISSDSNTSYSKQNRKSQLLKSQVIYNQTKPLSQRLPSCSKWTQEMASFYNSDISNEFSVEGIHISQTDLRRYWKICAEDFTVYRPKRMRYYEERCSRCREFGHKVKYCLREQHCRFCCSTKHTYVHYCPENCCLRCGQSPHGFCYLTSFQRVCNNCGNKGHDSTLCPDTWRRYHITTQGSRPVLPNKKSLKLKPKKVYCYNCSKTGHFGHECRATGVKQYPPLSTKIFSYESLMQPNSTSEVDEEVSFVAVKNPEVSKDYKENEFITTSLYFPRKVVLSLTKDKCSLLHTIQMLSEAQLDFQLSGKKNNKIIVTGTSKSISESKRLINIINSKSPYKEYNKLFLLSKKNKEEILSSKKNSSEYSPKKYSVPNEIEIFNPNKEMVEVTQNSCNKTSFPINTIGSVTTNVLQLIKNEESSTTNETNDVLMLGSSQKRLSSSSKDNTLNSKKKKKKSTKKDIPSHSDTDTLEITNEAIGPIINKEVITSSSIIKEEEEFLPSEQLSSSTSKEALEVKENIELDQEKESTYGKNCKHRLYLSAEAHLDQAWKNSHSRRIAFPQTKLEAIRAAKKLLRQNTGLKLPAILRKLTRLVGFFKGNYSLEKDRIVWVKYKQLSCLLFIKLKVGPGAGWMSSHCKLRRSINNFENTLIEPELYDCLSDLYLKVVDPPLEMLGDMLKFADNQIIILKQKLIESYKELGLSHSDMDTLEITNEAIGPSIINKEVITSSSIIKEEGICTSSLIKEDEEQFLPSEQLSSSASKEALEVKENIELVQETDSKYGKNCKHRLYLSAEAHLEQVWKNSRSCRLPFPQTKLEAIRAAKTLLRQNTALKLPSIIRKLMRLVGFFKGNYSENEDRIVWVKYQQLSSLLFLKLKVGPGAGWMSSHKKLRRSIKNSENTLIEPELYKRLSDLYLKVVDPPLEMLGGMLKFADNQIIILKQKLLESYKALGLSYSDIDTLEINNEAISPSIIKREVITSSSIIKEEEEDIINSSVITEE